MSARLFVMCLSEATLDLIEPWVEAGELPEFSKIIDNGARGCTAYHVPYLLTPQSWATILTGKSAGEHGVFDYWQRDEQGAFHQTNGSDVRCPAAWTYLGDAGRSCGLVNVPLTYPPQAIQGVMLSGQDAPGAHRSIAYPPELYDDLVRRFGRYHLKDIFPGGRSKRDYLSLIESEVQHQADLLEYLLQSREWDFFMAYSSATAMAQHYFWSDMARGEKNRTVSESPYGNVVLETYRCIDRMIARLRKAAGEAAVTWVISECGAGPLRSGIQMNTWLAQNGLLSYRLHRQRMTSQVAQIARRAVASFRKGAQRWIPKDLYYLANGSAIKHWTHDYLARSDIDWSRTQMYYRGKGEGNLYVNLVGREPYGIVPPEEYESMRCHAVEALAKLRNPATGEQPIVRIHRREDLYRGPHVDRAPDLVIEWKDSAYMPTEDDRDKSAIFCERWREHMNWPTSGSHRKAGVLLAVGPGVGSGVRIGTHDLRDLLPTWLHMLDVSQPAELEGRVIDALFA